MPPAGARDLNDVLIGLNGTDLSLEIVVVDYAYTVPNVAREALHSRR